MNKKRKSAEDDEVETRKSSRQTSNSSIKYNTSSDLHILWRGFKIQKRDKYKRALEMLCTAQV